MDERPTHGKGSLSSSPTERASRVGSTARPNSTRAVVTADAGGIGRAIADALIANGARVLVSEVDLYLSLEFRNIKNSR
jgi:hypothetical protein